MFPHHALFRIKFGGVSRRDLFGALLKQIPQKLLFRYIIVTLVLKKNFKSLVTIPIVVHFGKIIRLQVIGVDEKIGNPNISPCKLHFNIRVQLQQ